MPSVVPVHPWATPVPLGRIEQQDLDVLRLLLRGSSVVDWYRLHFRSREEIEAFIRVNGFDPTDPDDRAHLEDVRVRALAFLREHLKYRRVPEVIAQAPVEELFEYASGRKGRRAYRLYACITLKVMHVIHYVQAHDLLAMLPVSGAEVSVLLRGKVERTVRGLRERGYPVIEFSGNSKTYDSIISKLLAKKDTQATQVFDKLRFRFVTQRLEDVPPLMVALSRELFPFNYTVPNQCDNSLVDLERLLARAGNVTAIRLAQDPNAAMNEQAVEVIPERKNEFSGPGYRVVHLVAEVPLRIDRVLPSQSPRLQGLGPVVFGTCEFQLVDRQSARGNETGENRHALYKRRQRSRVKERLERGKRQKVTPPPPSTDPSGPR